MLFTIVEIDRDYRVETGREVRDFHSPEAAKAFCREESGIGYDYFVEGPYELG